MITRIISGGQTGADRAALDVAIKLGIPHGGRPPAYTDRNPFLIVACKGKITTGHRLVCNLSASS